MLITKLNKRNIKSVQNNHCKQKSLGICQIYFLLARYHFRLHKGTCSKERINEFVEKGCSLIKLQQ